mgnify:CR=1 FL=1
MKSNLKAAVIGLGVGETHIIALQSHPNCQVVAICDLDEETLREVSPKYPSCRPTKGPNSVLDDPSIDLVCIASYDDAHEPQVIRALRNNKHVFVEKPLCRTREELVGIKKLLRSNQRLHLASNLVLRAAPVYRWLRASVARGDFGEIYAFDGDYLYGRIHKITSGWRRDTDRYSVMQGGGVHLIDLMLWVTGQQPRTAYTQGNQICTRDTDFRENDFMASTFSFESGLVGRITANFGCVHRHQHAIRIFGTKATFILDDCGPRMHRSRDPEGKAESIEQAILPASKWGLIPDFVKEISEINNLSDIGGI